MKKQIRENFRSQVFSRDNNTCQVCGIKHSTIETIDAHHITDRSEMPNGGYVKENGITVCRENCHFEVEWYHITEGEDWRDGLHPDDLYKMINSSKKLAIIASNKL